MEGEKTIYAVSSALFIYVPNMGFAKSLPRAIKLMANFRVTIFSCCQLASSQHATTRDFTQDWGLSVKQRTRKVPRKGDTAATGTL